MNIPEKYRYSRTHEWVETLGDGRVRIGITDHAQDALGDIVFVGLPAVGDALAQGQSFADVESVKAVAEIFSPVDGEVTAVNDALTDAPEKVNEDAYGAWLIEARAVAFEELLDATAYAALLEAEA